MNHVADMLPSSRTWLKVMLWAILFGAAIGVSAVLFAPFTAIYSVTSTAFLVAGCALMMMLTSFLVDRERTRASGLLGMGLVIIIFFIVLALIWDIDRVISGAISVRWWVVTSSMWMTIGWLLLTGIPSMVFLWLMHSERARPAGWIGLVIAASTFIILMIGTTIYVTRAAASAVSEHWHLTGGWIGMMGTIAVGCLVGSSRLFDRLWVWIGVIAAAIVAMMAIVGIWTGVSTRFGENMVACLISAAVAVCYANLVLLFKVRQQHRWGQYISIAVAVMTAIVVCLFVIFMPRWDYTPPASSTEFQEFLERSLIAGAILSATGLLALAVLTRLNRPFAIERSAEQIRDVTIVCPVCQKKQQFRPGQAAACQTCGLRIEVRVAEPRCPACNYLLYHLRSPQCPECGHNFTRT